MRYSLNTNNFTIEVTLSASEEYVPSEAVLVLNKQCAELATKFHSKKAEIDTIFQEYVNKNVLPELQQIADKVKEFN